MGFALTHAGSRYLRYKPLPHTGFLTFCASLLAMAACVAASANDGAIVGVGGAMKLMQAHPSVRLVSESVTVRISEERTDRNNDLYADVDCVFVFQNTGDAVEVEMGFPEFGWGAWTSLGHMTGTTGFLSFTSQVDGQPWPTEVVDSQVAPNESLQRWRVKMVPFAAGQRRTVRDCYRMLLGQVIWSEKGSRRTFSYILGTGASWHGKIGLATLHVDFSSVRNYSILDASPLTGMRVSGAKSLTWARRDFEPSEDDNLSVSFVPETYAVVIHGIGPDSRDHVGLTSDQVRLRDGYVMVPVNTIADAVASGSVWAAQKQRVLFGRERDERVSLAPRSHFMRIGGRTHQLGVSPYVEWNPTPYVGEFQRSRPSKWTLFVPLRSVIEALGGRVYRLDHRGAIHATVPSR